MNNLRADVMISEWEDSGRFIGINAFGVGVDGRAMWGGEFESDRPRFFRERIRWLSEEEHERMREIRPARIPVRLTPEEREEMFEALRVAREEYTAQQENDADSNEDTEGEYQDDEGDDLSDEEDDEQTRRRAEELSLPHEDQQRRTNTFWNDVLDVIDEHDSHREEPGEP